MCAERKALHKFSIAASRNFSKGDCCCKGKLLSEIARSSDPSEEMVTVILKKLNSNGFVIIITVKRKASKYR